ncbi:LOW QUALITY PROTEIN: hypothetical protein TorRG33x02_035200 [Trema orientale]|uniref:Uncharacterized protein n=1 Tax=Trema orientale TaxID=63057 RepID=A0A2P5FSZ3_TREOI|nr:LOW QUALITY PROTEIN: hypothetical protein TorRG33x02_035200 [Trema orientale]
MNFFFFSHLKKMEKRNRFVLFLYLRREKKNNKGKLYASFKDYQLIYYCYFIFVFELFLPSKKQLYFFYNFMNLFVGNLSDRLQKVAGKLSHFTLSLFCNSS